VTKTTIVIRNKNKRIKIDIVIEVGIHYHSDSFESWFQRRVWRDENFQWNEYWESVKQESIQWQRF